MSLKEILENLENKEKINEDLDVDILESLMSEVYNNFSVCVESINELINKISKLEDKRVLIEQMEELREIKSVIQSLDDRYAENVVDRLEIFFMLKEIEKYNQDREEENKIKVKYKDYSIENPFYDETGRRKVNPYEYYGEDIVYRFIDKWE